MIYVMSDIHGQGKLFNKMLKKIDFSEKDVLYILGDITDRGPDGIKLLLKTMRSRNIHMLLGNHELMMFNTVTSKNKADMFKYAEHWFSNGGKITFESFLNYSDSTKEKIIKYIDKLPSEFRLTVNKHNYILCHAMPHPSSYRINPFENSIEGLKYSSEREMSAWERYPDLNDKNFENTVIIHGHTPTKLHDKNGKMTAGLYDNKGFIVNDIKKAFEINIDCGCSYIPYGMNDGQLCCLRLDDMKLFYTS